MRPHFAIRCADNALFQCFLALGVGRSGHFGPVEIPLLLDYIFSVFKPFLLIVGDVGFSRGLKRHLQPLMPWNNVTLGYGAVRT